MDLRRVVPAAFAVAVVAATAACLEPFTGTGGAGGTIATNSGTSGSTSSADASSSSSGCAACAPGDHQTASCVSGACQYACDDGFGDCDSDRKTCETDLTKDGNCGGCGVDCATECVASGPTAKCNDPVEVTAGANHTCALRGDGSVWCWGDNSFGQIGIGSGAPDQFAPVKIALPFVANHVSASSYGTCATSAGGAIACWGGDDGSPTTMPLLYSGTPYQGVSSVAGGVSTGDSLLIEGPSASVEQFKLTSSTEPQATLVIVGAVGVAAGQAHDCALDVGGTVRCWGDNAAGQLGQGAAGGSSTSPKEVPGLSASSIAAGVGHTCARTMAGAVVCWGRNIDQESGGPPTQNFVLSPLVVPLPGNATADVARAGWYDSAAISNGQLFLWGGNGSHQVSSSNISKSGPILYPGLDGVAAVALGAGHTCALLTTGALKCWGSNSHFQLGDGTQDDSPTPVDVKWN